VSRVTCGHTTYNARTTNVLNVVHLVKERKSGGLTVTSSLMDVFFVTLDNLEECPARRILNCSMEVSELHPAKVSVTINVNHPIGKHQMLAFLVLVVVVEHCLLHERGGLDFHEIKSITTLKDFFDFLQLTFLLAPHAHKFPG
jgi:hypothetical protein